MKCSLKNCNNKEYQLHYKNTLSLCYKHRYEDLKTKLHKKNCECNSWFCSNKEDK